MSSKFSPHDEYGFLRPESFDYAEYEGFMSDYLRLQEAEQGSEAEEVREEGNSQQSPERGLAGGEWGSSSEERGARPLPHHARPEDRQHRGGGPDQHRPAQDLSEQHLLRQLQLLQLPRPSVQHPEGIRQQQPQHWLLPGTQLHRRTALPHHQGRGHIERLQMPWALFASKWFVCLYCEVLLVETVLRVWDTVFYEGSKILFRVALGLLKLNQDRLLNKTDFASLAGELRLLEEDRITVSCHSFLHQDWRPPQGRDQPAEGGGGAGGEG